MITLVLVRHAKSDWGQAALDDHDRPLNERGARDAPRMAGRLAQTGFVPERILSSTALRARTTAADFGAEFAVEVDLVPHLYGASESTLLSVAEHSGARNLIVVAHDPGLSMLADRLSSGDITHMPTCAVATFRWDHDDWSVASAVDPQGWTFDSPR
jgi:phosphohistidine phosphatase